VILGAMLLHSAVKRRGLIKHSSRGPIVENRESGDREKIKKLIVVYVWRAIYIS
jgi:hypothetical protein